MNNVERGGYRWFKDAFSWCFDKLVYQVETGITSTETFALRFDGLVNKAKIRLIVVDSPFLATNDLLLAAKRGVSVEVISNKDGANPTLTQNLKANGITVHLLDPAIFNEIDSRFMVSDGKNVLAVAVAKKEYIYVEKSVYLAEKLTKDFEELAKSA